MDPVAFQIGSFSIAWYGILITAGILLGAWWGTREAKRRGLNTDLFEGMIFWAIVWGIIGARVVFVLTSPDVFRDASLLDYVNIRQGGISIHGGLGAGVLALIFLAWRHKVNFYRYADLFVPGVALGIIGGRIGNIMNGSDTVGRVTGWPIGYEWPAFARGFHDAVCNPANPENLVQYCANVGGQVVMTAPVHFTQLYGALIGVVLVIGAVFWLRSRRAGWAFWQFVLWYSILRAVFEETFRLNPLTWNVYLAEGLDAPGIGLFTMTQIASVPLIIIAVVMLIRLRTSPEQPVLEPQRDDTSRSQRA